MGRGRRLQEAGGFGLMGHDNTNLGSVRWRREKPSPRFRRLSLYYLARWSEPQKPRAGTVGTTPGGRRGRVLGRTRAGSSTISTRTHGGNRVNDVPLAGRSRRSRPIAPESPPRARSDRAAGADVEPRGQRPGQPLGPRRAPIRRLRPRDAGSRRLDLPDLQRRAALPQADPDLLADARRVRARRRQPVRRPARLGARRDGDLPWSPGGWGGGCSGPGRGGSPR